MRRNVRYTPLGKPRIVSLMYGLDHTKVEAEILDESVNGYGLRVKDIGNMAAGQTVIIEGPKGKVQGAIMRIEPAGGGAMRVGVQFATTQRPI